MGKLYYNGLMPGLQNIPAEEIEHSTRIKIPIPAIRIRIEKENGNIYLVFTGQDTEIWLAGAFSDYEIKQAAAELLGMLYTERNK